MSKLQRFLSQLRYFPRTLRLVWQAAPGWAILWLILLLVQGLLPAGIVYLTRLLVDRVAAAIGNGLNWLTVTPLLWPAALIATFMLLMQMLQTLNGWVRTGQAEFVQDYINNLIHQKATTVDLAFYESPAYYDRLERARSEASNRSLLLLESAGGLLENGITFMAMAAILLAYGPWLPLLLLLSTLPAFYVVLHHNRRYERWWHATTAERRWVQYYDVMLTSAVVAPEMRLFKLGPAFRARYQKLRAGLRQTRLQLRREQSLARLGVMGISLIFAGGAVAWIGSRALQGFLTLGDLALFYQAFSRGQGLMQSLLGNVSQLYENSLFLENLFTYLSLEPHIVDSSTPRPMPVPLKQGIQFQDVTFRYPDSATPALDHFNFTIPAGKVVAIVGANGAGKSTLVKLLCRFYEPETGVIQIDGIDLRHISLEQLRRQISVLFQFPVTYHATAAQNIAMGDLTAAPSLEEIQAAAQEAGAAAFIEALPQGYETQLGKSLANGLELSGGEWQRVALARAILRRAQIIVLDEPTSAMDSWAEIDWLDRFRRFARERTAIIITHRFTTAMRADVIHVMDRGRVIESGTHAELLAQDGHYAQSWRAQMRGVLGHEMVDDIHQPAAVYGTWNSGMEAMQ